MWCLNHTKHWMEAVSSIIDVRKSPAVTSLICLASQVLCWLLHSPSNTFELLEVQQGLEDIFTISDIEMSTLGYLQLRVLLVAFWGLGTIQIVALSRRWQSREEGMGQPCLPGHQVSWAVPSDRAPLRTSLVSPVWMAALVTSGRELGALMLEPAI